MSQNFDNRRRAFADVVSIDAWHDDFCGEVSSADLHVDVVFGTARIGGETDSPVRFRLSIKRAEVVVILPEVEPVGIDRASVSRDEPEISGRLTQTVEQIARANVKGDASAAVGMTGPSGSASLGFGGEASLKASSTFERSAVVNLMQVTQSKTADGHYRWNIEPGENAFAQIPNVLQGRPWNGTKAPRLKLVDKRRDRSKGIPPTVRVEIRCRREDLHIEDLEIKDQSLWDAAKAKFGFKNKVGAAESYIRDRLFNEGLVVGNIEDAFAEITIAAVTAGAN